MTWVFDRLKEKSTWMGLIGVLSTCGVLLSPELKEAIIAVGVSLVSLIAILSKEKSA